MTVITTNPEDVLAAVGRDVTLTCNASGADNLQFQWMRGNKSIPLQATGFDTNTLTIDDITVDDSGKYRCMVSSDGVTIISECGALSVVGKLYVLSYNLYAWLNMIG